MHHAFKLLRSVEMLLLLEQKDIAGQGETANGLTVSSSKGQYSMPVRVWSGQLTGQGKECPRCS
jgi:hypothetical protein